MKFYTLIFVPFWCCKNCNFNFRMVIKRRKTTCIIFITRVPLYKLQKTCVLKIQKVDLDLVLIRPHKEEEEAHYQVKTIVTCRLIEGVNKNVHCCNRGEAIFLGEF